MHTRHTAIVGLLVAVCAAVGTPVLAQVPEVSVTRGAGRVVAEVSNKDVRIRKEVAPDGSLTVITTKLDQLTIQMRKGRLVLSTPATSVALTDGTPSEVSSVLTMLAGSEAAREGRALLAGLGAAGNDPGRHMLLLTRAILEFGEGGSDALRSHQRSMQEHADIARRRAGGRGVVTRIALQSGGGDRGPGECWDAYAREAVEIYDDYMQCLIGLKWYDVFGSTGCALVYTVRAEGAMWWFINCSGGFPFSG